MPTRGRAAGAQTAPKSKVIVRMYRIGFGDCFLLLVPDRGRHRRILIDCGSIKRDPHLDKGGGDVAKQVVKDVTDTDGTPRIDVVIATHRHKDHVGGFADEVWDTVEVGEVWLPWTESEDDPTAIGLRALQDRLADRLAARLMAVDKPWLAELAANAQSNAAAMARLRNGFKSRARHKPRYLGAGENDPKKISTPHLPGVDVHVLGPPRDERVIGRELPQDDGELYLRLGADVGPGTPPSPDLLQPFGDQWVVDAPSNRLEERNIALLRDAVRFDPESALAAIDDALNNTSLILVFEVGGRFLLFPGDAQWGPWQMILADDEAVGLLHKTSFYKVGHHASHNATPRDFVEAVVGKQSAEPLAAMVSVTAHGSYSDIPRQPLMEALRRRFDHVAVSDVKGKQSGFARASKWSVDFEFEPA